MADLQFMATVLVIEDSPILRVLLADALRRAGYETLEAGNGAEGLEILARQTPDALVMDLQMPVLDGLSLLRRVRGEPRLRSLPVIVLSVESGKASIMEAARLGISAYILKSRFVLDGLLESLAKVCGPRPAELAPPGDTTAPAPVAPENVVVPAGAPAGPVEDAAAALRGLKPLLTRSEVMAKVEGCEQLKAFSPTVTQLLSMTADPNTSMARVVNAIGQDHAVALKILKLANSVVYTRGEPVTSVKNAVMRIGMENIRQTVLNISVMDHFSSSKFAGLLSLAQFWEHAISTGLIAAELTHARDPKGADAAFTGGLLHDVGRLVYIEQLGETYSTVLRTAWLMELPLEQVESRLLLLNHADVMDRVLHAWKFSKDLINPLVFHHLSAGNIRQVALNQLQAVATMSLANRISHALLLGSSGNLAVYPFDDLCHLLKVEARVIQAIEQGIPQQTADIKLAMLAHGSEASWMPVRDECLKKLERPFRPLFVGAEPQFDAYGMLCRTLGTAAGTEAPNVAVVHIQHGRDRVPLTTRLKQAEEESGSGALPVIVLSPGGRLTLEDGFMAQRRALHLSTPVVLPRLIRTINAALRPEELAAAA